MAATETVYLRLDPSLKDRLARAARKEKRSLNAELILRLERSLATGADAAVSAGLAVSSAPVASDGALAEPAVASSTNPETRRGIGAGTGLAAAAAAGPGRDDNQATSGERPGSASASPFVPDALKPSVETPAEVAKAVAASVPGVTFAHSLAGPAKPLSKQEQAGRKK